MNIFFFLLALLTRPYHPVTIAQLSQGSVVFTHVAVTGTVTLVKSETDGDLHIRLTEGTQFIVAECIPKLPCSRPSLGRRITVKGISRYDKEHVWWEVHPVEEWSYAK